MRNSVWYMLLLFLGISSAAGYSYYDSQTVSITVNGKSVDEGRSRYGISSGRFVLDTDKGRYTLSTFPVIGFVFDAEEVHNQIPVGSTITVRAGKFPPAFNGEHERRSIFAIAE